MVGNPSAETAKGDRITSKGIVQVGAKMYHDVSEPACIPDLYNQSANPCGESPSRRKREFPSCEMAMRRLFNHDLIGVNLGRLASADMPGRHAKNAFPVDFDVTGFDRRSQAGLE